MGRALPERPHRGSLDFALSHCTQLRHLCIPWQLTSTRFLASIARMSHLELFSAEGHPPASCDPLEFATMIETRTWPKLQKLKFSEFALSHVSQTWTARPLRRLIRLCKSMNIQFSTRYGQ
ncbi:hypothetical protein P389DRAFT_208511 [Cystobasidium minutum MCA 4210]|uniref:uncharacterized protein n=1 Tax=Cystobasidium minutum MCA 4210 TaxID=1397322 RepID=UPI0034CDD9B8|eukprot:jgi/Rhomi1/208511/estExt_Genemark1.C_2_t10193